jgi:hypothetical protein
MGRGRLRVNQGRDVFTEKVQQSAFFLSDDPMRVLSPNGRITAVFCQHLDQITSSDLLSHEELGGEQEAQPGACGMNQKRTMVSFDISGDWQREGLSFIHESPDLMPLPEWTVYQAIV